MNSILINVMKDLSFIAGSYIAGAIHFCYIIGKIIGKKKLTEIGDKNPGGWNLVFNVSKFWGFIGIALDMAKGYFAYYFTYMFISTRFMESINTSENQLISILAGCAAVAGHNYSPFMKFKGGKGLAAWGGFVIAVSPWVIIPAAAGLLFGLLIARNMIWSVSLGIIFSGLFLWFIKDNYLFIVMIVILLLIMIPTQINRRLPISTNFKFRKEATLGDLFKPKIR